MTEGIIHRIFREEISSYDYLDEVMAGHLLELERKLIAEIKKDIEETAISCPYAIVKTAYAYTLKQLIGEQE